jgi:hypothetical protein
MKSESRLECASFPWQPLVEGSDSIGRLAVKLAAYKGTAAGYAVAAAHISALRQAEIPYSFRPRRDANYPFGVFVVRKQIRQAKETIGPLGLGADGLNEPALSVFSRVAFSPAPITRSSQEDRISRINSTRWPSR